MKHLPFAVGMMFRGLINAVCASVLQHLSLPAGFDLQEDPKALQVLKRDLMGHFSFPLSLHLKLLLIGLSRAGWGRQHRQLLPGSNLALLRAPGPLRDTLGEPLPSQSMAEYSGITLGMPLPSQGTRISWNYPGEACIVVSA